MEKVLEYRHFLWAAKIIQIASQQRKAQTNCKAHSTKPSMCSFSALRLWVKNTVIFFVK
jgi:hypothetical protein